MSLFDRLRPKWKNSNAEVRREALRALSSERQTVFVEAARNDPSSAVRLLAVERIDDVDVLSEVVRGDSDEKVRARAQERLDEQVLEGAAGDEALASCEGALARIGKEESLLWLTTKAHHGEIRLAALARIADEAVVAKVARRGADAILRSAALERISDPLLLEKLVLGKSSPADVATAALERINDIAVLDSLVRNNTVTKVLRRRASARLDEIAGDRHPARIRERREQGLVLCKDVEKISLSVGGDRLMRLAELKLQWEQLIGKGDGEESTVERYSRACRLIDEQEEQAALRAQREDELAAAHQAACREREALCTFVEGLAVDQAGDGLKRAEREWRELAPVDGADVAALARRFASACESLRKRHEGVQAKAAKLRRLESLVVEAEGLANAADLASAERRWEGLREEWTALDAELGCDPDMPQVQASVQEALEAKRIRAREERERQDRDSFAALVALCERLEAMPQQKGLKIGPAERALRDAQQRSGDLGPLPEGEDREQWKARLMAGHQAVTERLRGLEKEVDWQLWANAELQEQLIARAEALLQSENMSEILGESRKLQQEWKRFGAAPRKKSQTLWDRFRLAMDELHQRGEDFLDENQRLKEELCDRVAGVAAASSWKETAELIQRTQVEWKAIGPVRHKISDELWQRFRQPADEFFERRRLHFEERKREQEVQLVELRAICEAAENLAESMDWEEAGSQFKALQTKWKQIRGFRSSEADGLWERFRVASDTFFERSRRRDEVEAELEVGRAEELLAGLSEFHSTLSGADALPAEEVAVQIDKALQDWLALGALPGSAMIPLKERFAVLCGAIEERCPPAWAASAHGGTRLRQRENLCRRMEESARLYDETGNQAAPLGLAERLKLSMAANTIGGDVSFADGQIREYEEKSEQAIERWQNLGPAVGDAERVLSERFDRAREQFEGVRSRRALRADQRMEDAEGGAEVQEAEAGGNEAASGAKCPDGDRSPSGTCKWDFIIDDAETGIEKEPPSIPPATGGRSEEGQPVLSVGSSFTGRLDAVSFDRRTSLQ